MENYFDDDVEGEDIWGKAMRVPEQTEAEQEFSKVLQLIREADGMKMYADVFTKLYDSYYELKEELARKQDTIDQLQDQVNRYEETIESDNTGLAEANQTIEQLRTEVQHAHSIADAMHTRELYTYESLDEMKRMVARMEKELEARKRTGLDDEEVGVSALKEQKKIDREKKVLQGELEWIRLDDLVLERKTSGEEQNIERVGKIKRHVRLDNYFHLTGIL